jgi:glycosyltransferase involved in cell wall biosynthesis
MHVVQALVSLNLGGSELVATELTEYLAANHQKVTVMAADGPLSGRIHACNAEHLDWSIGRKRLNTLAFIGRVSEWLERERPDILHVHSRLPAWICRLAIRKLEPSARPAFITSMHGHYSVNRYSAVMASGDRVIAVSEHIRDYTLLNYPMADPNRVVTIHGGTDPEAFPYGYRPSNDWFSSAFREFPELQDKRLLCLPGRLSRYKGHIDFIELIAGLAHSHPDVHGVIVGRAKPGSRYRDELEGLAERSGVLDRVTFTGARMDMRDWMAAAEIVFSLCGDPPEAFGRTMPEALYLGIPAIGWDHGGVQEVLEKMFPKGAVRPDDRVALAARTREFLGHKPVVPPSHAFRLTESMKQTIQLYQSVRRSPES